MKCTRCGKCCEATRMELSEEDISRLQRAGYRREDFVVFEEDAISRLRNVEGACFFFDLKERSCREYDHRPIGCHIYPVQCDDTWLVFVDDFCPDAKTVSKREMSRKGDQLVRHLRTIDDEAAVRRGRR